MDFVFWLLSYVVPFLAVLTVIVFVHEMGHYLVARWNGIAIQTFSIGFGPELVGFNDRHGTRWRISAIPLGGYVRFVGDMNAGEPARSRGHRQRRPGARAAAVRQQERLAAHRRGGRRAGGQRHLHVPRPLRAAARLRPLHDPAGDRRRDRRVGGRGRGP